MATSRHAHRIDRAFVDDAVGQGEATAVVRIDGEGGDRDGVIFLRIFEHVLLRQGEASVHAAPFPDVELRRPVLRLGEFVAAEAEFRHGLADLRGDGRVGRQELVELEGVLLVLLPEPGAAGGIGSAPAVGFADEAHREHLPDPVVGVELVAWQRIEVPGQRGFRVFEEIPADELEAGRVIGFRLRKGHAVRRVLREAQAEAVDHDGLFAGLVIAGPEGSDERQRQPVGVEAVDGHLLLRVLAAGERLAVFVAALAADMPDDAGAGHQVAFVGGVDEDFRGVEAARRP